MSVACLIVPILAVTNPAPAAAQTGTCVTSVYSDAQTAKAKFADDCGQPFENTTDHRCDWVPGGWVCEGPGNTDSVRAATPRDEPASSKPPKPSIIQVEKEPGFVSVVWRQDDRTKGVNVYRDGQWMASVNSPHNVYNDFGGREGSTYELIAYGYGTDQFSERAILTASNDQMDPVIDLNVEALGENRVVLNWTRANAEVSGWNIYRNGEFWQFLSVSEGYKDEIFDFDAGNAFVYEVQAVRGTLSSTRTGTFGPAAQEYIGSTGRRSKVEPWPGNNTPLVEGLPARDAKTRSLAATAEASSATAHEEYADFQESWGGVAAAVQGLAGRGPKNWPAVAFSLLDVREERREAEAAFTKAYEDLRAYEACMASNCGASSNNGGGSDYEDPQDKPQVGGNEGATRPGELGDGLRG